MVGRWLGGLFALWVPIGWKAFLEDSQPPIADRRILHDGFGTNGSSFSEQHSEYFKSYDSFGKETTQGADCCDSESLEDDPVDDTLRFRLEDEIADDFEQEAKLSVAYRFRCFLHHRFHNPF